MHAMLGDVKEIKRSYPEVKEMRGEERGHERYTRLVDYGICKPHVGCSEVC